MGILNNRLKSRRKAMSYEKQKMAGHSDRVPSYGKGGRYKTKYAWIKKAFLFAVCLTAVFMAAVHLAALMEKDTEQANVFTVEPDVMALNKINDYEKNHASEDTDGDGLTNTQELQYGTNVRNPDTDGDRVCDYSEIFLNGTDPLRPDDGLLRAVQLADEAEGALTGSPYKIHDIVMWPDEMRSRAYGGVTATKRGYRFCNFTGWVRFPEDGYAYSLTDDGYKALSRREEEDAWHVSGTCEVILVPEPLNEQCILSVFGHMTKVSDGLGKILAAVLPDKGFIWCRKELSGTVNEPDGAMATMHVRFKGIRT